MKISIANLTPAARLAYVPTEAEIIARLKKSKAPEDKAEAETRQAAWAAWVADTKKRGVTEPIKVLVASPGSSKAKGYNALVKQWEVVDGRNRLAAAREAGLTEVPCVEVKEADVNSLVISTLAHRKGVTKGSIAYLALTLHNYLVGRGKGRKEKRSDCAYDSLASLAAAIGVGERTMDDAAATLAYLKEHPSEKAKLEPFIIAGLIDVNAARAGAGGGAETRGKPRRPSSYASATKTLRSLSSQLREVEAWKEEDRAAALTAFRNAFTGLSATARAILIASLTEEEEAP